MVLIGGRRSSHVAAVRRSARLAVTKDWNGRVEWQGRDSASKTASVAGK